LCCLPIIERPEQSADCRRATSTARLPACRLCSLLNCGAGDCTALPIHTAKRRHDGSYTRYYVTRDYCNHCIPCGMLHYRLRHSEITAFCRLAVLWLCAAAALDETNDMTNYSRTSRRSVTRPVTSPIQSDRHQSSISTKIGAFSSYGPKLYGLLFIAHDVFINQFPFHSFFTCHGFVL